MDAQHVCRMYNSTLPIVDNPDRQRSVVAALYNFTLNGTAEVWLGATASDDGSNNWRWLDGSPCNATCKLDEHSNFAFEPFGIRMLNYDPLANIS